MTSQDPITENAIQRPKFGSQSELPQKKNGNITNNRMTETLNILVTRYMQNQMKQN